MPKRFNGCIFELQTKIFCNHCTTSQDGNIFQHSLATVTKTWCFNSHYIKGTTNLVKNQCWQSFTIHIICNDQERTVGFQNTFQQWQNLLNVRNFLVCNQDIRVVQISHHFFTICHHVLRQVATVKLHSFYDIQLCFHTLGLFDSDNAIVANFFHSFRDVFTDFFATRRNGSNLSNRFLVRNWNRSFFQSADSSRNCCFNSAADTDWVGTRSHVFNPFADDSLGQYSSSRCSVSSDIVGL